jgi:hypothetical protein
MNLTALRAFGQEVVESLKVVSLMILGEVELLFGVLLVI